VNDSFAIGSPSLNCPLVQFAQIGQQN
jgi:hypothetical protein